MVGIVAQTGATCQALFWDILILTPESFGEMVGVNFDGSSISKVTFSTCEFLKFCSIHSISIWVICSEFIVRVLLISWEFSFFKILHLLVVVAIDDIFKIKNNDKETVEERRHYSILFHTVSFNLNRRLLVRSVNQLNELLKFWFQNLQLKCKFW